MFFKKKRINPVTERTPDTVPFEIPQIRSEEEKRAYKKNHFVSPIFGEKVKDNIIIPSPFKRSGDLDKQFDNFRTKPKLNNEERKRKYGSAYPEFDVIRGANLEEAISNQHKRSNPNDKAVMKERAKEVFSSEKTFRPDIFEENIQKTKTNINDFLNVHKEEQIIKEPLPVAENRFVDTPEVTRKSKGYKLPPISLLSKSVTQVNDPTEWIEKQIEILNQTFIEFQVGARVYTYTKGPTVTRYEIILDSGVNVKKITNLSDNIKMALAAKDIRIEAPIPGKSTLGIEVPNEIAEIVNFVDTINTKEFMNADDPLTVALGLDIDGKCVYTSLAKMPHGLVAGATGSGKSVCINTILMSLLFKYTPEELKLLLIDPKMVELSAYNEIPHLITPVINDSKIATAGLKWLVEEMDRRFILFANERVRDIKGFNISMRIADITIMPYIVVIVDELADLMMVSSASVEESIMRLTQKARACGIHLIIATQRPSTDIIKGTIKSNIPTRIAFSVSSHIDSQTIIDSSGADKLLGRGDMLFAENGQPKIRVQGAYISDQDILNVNDYIRAQAPSNYLFTKEKLIKSVTSVKNSDELLEEVARYVVVQGEASMNKISREFNIGFNRAKSIVEILSNIGVVSANLGSRSRDVLVSLEELENLLKDN
ncbi:MAG: DNA translocase FtsK [Candidatus Izemoplasma sp.]